MAYVTKGCWYWLDLVTNIVSSLGPHSYSGWNNGRGDSFQVIILRKTKIKNIYFKINEIND